MNITFLNRKYNPSEVSIEKLFGYVSESLMAKGVTIQSLENPYGSGLPNLLKSIFYFRKKVFSKSLVHISGQIHFAGIALKTSKIVITVHDLGIYRNLSWVRLLFFKIFWVYLPFFKAKKIVAISEKTKSEIIQLMPSVASKTVVIPNCLTMPIQEFRAIKNPPVPTFLIVGTRSNKNIERAIEAMSGLKVEVIIVGRLTESQSSLLKNTRTLYSNFFQIDEEELISLYQKSDYLLFPSVYEGFGLPILEAQANNVIPIISNLSPMSEVGGIGVIYVNPFSIDSIRTAVLKALKLSDDEKADFIKLGRENLKKYEVDQVSQQYLELYKECLS